MNGILIISLITLLFIMLVVGFYFFIDYLKKNNTIENNIAKLNIKTLKTSKKLLDEEFEYESIYGINEEENFIIKLEKRIIYSGIRTKIPFLNATIYIVAEIILSAIVFAITLILSNFLFAIAAVILLIILLHAMLVIMESNTYQHIEDSVVTFVNLIQNFAKTDNDIINILSKTIPYLDNPLQSYVEEAYILGKRTGDSDLALNTLQKNINHKIFKQILKSLINCSHYEADYSEVIDDAKYMLMEYLKGKRERKEIARGAKVEITLLICVSGYVVYSIQGMLTKSLIATLMSNIIGQATLCISIIVLLVCLYNLIFLGRNKD